MLNLIYIWNDNAANVSPKTGFSLNTKYDVNFNDDMNKPKLTIRENPSYVSDFWGRNIVDAIAIVGENGSGKTMLLNYIIESLSYIEVNEPPYDYFILFRDESEEKFICYVSDKYSEIFSSDKNNQEDMNEEIIFYKITDHKKKLENYKIGYFTSALSLSDYREDKLGGIYDASIGHLIHKNLHNKIDQNYAKLGQESELRTYFCTEDEKIINFIYGNISKLDMGFPDLNRIGIEIYIYTKNQDLLFGNMEKEQNDEKFQVQKTFLSEFTRTIEKKYNGTWITELILNLIINIIRYLCVETNSRDNKTKQWDKVISILPKCADKMDTTENIFETAIVFLDSLKEAKLFDKIHSKTYTDYIAFIKWIQSHEKIFINYPGV